MFRLEVRFDVAAIELDLSQVSKLENRSGRWKFALNRP